MLCEKCGTELIDGVCPKCVQNEENIESRYEGKLKTIFSSPNEKLVTVLGNSYIENFLQNGSVKNGFVVVSDKRVYFQGNNYYISYDEDGEQSIIQNKQSRMVDLKDVTGTGTDSYANVKWKISGFVGIALFLLFFLIIRLGV